VHAGEQEARPERDARRDVQEGAAHADALQQHHRDEGAERQAYAAECDAAREEDCDDGDGADVVDDGEREQEDAERGRRPLAERGEHADGERDVGRHGHAPAARARAAAVEREVDQGRGGHAPERGDDGQGGALPARELAPVHFAPDLEADDEEEDRHQPFVDQEVQRRAHDRRADPERDLGVPEVVVGRAPGRVGPRERGAGGGE
jgi:hypothetical protein